MASMNTPVSCRSVTPGANAPAASSRARSAMRTEARMAATSSDVLTRRARRSNGSPSMSSADGNAFGRSRAADGVMASVATVRTVAAPSIPCSTFRKFPALNEIP